MRRMRRTCPGVVATATWPRTGRTTRASSSSPTTSASMSRGRGDMGSTRPQMPSSDPISSSARTSSSRTLVSPAMIRLPTAWPASAPVPPKRCWSTSSHSRPRSSSADRAASAMRRSPGGIRPSSRRRRPDDPPSSATVTTAVTSSAIRRTARSVANRPWPPPRLVMAVMGWDSSGVEWGGRGGRWRLPGQSLSMSRWMTLTSMPLNSPSLRPSASDMATLRWWPPVQPMAMDMWFLPSRR